jgi:hypothetical protein
MAAAKPGWASVSMGSTSDGFSEAMAQYSHSLVAVGHSVGIDLSDHLGSHADSLTDHESD